jgi:single-strand DNA-binding protein
VEDDEVQSLNIALVRGTCSSPAEFRVLPSGDSLAQLQVTTRVGESALSVPISVRAPKQWIEQLDAGDDVMVVGHVRRRFFRAGGATASRVEVEADAIAPVRNGRRMQAVRRRIDALLANLET